MIENDLRSLLEQRLAEHGTSGKSIAACCKEQAIRESILFLAQENYA
ncbi:MAG: hypothetical protein ACOX0F_13155 [Syntrophomonadaceae bacterium]|jgi:hypothetical protein